jgi:hypothetical protein
MNRIIFFIICLFLYIFNIVPIVGPANIGTRIYLGVLGALYVCFTDIIYNARVIKLMVCNIPLVLFSIITILINDTRDIWYIQFAILNICYLFGALFIVKLYPNECKVSYNKFLLYVVYCILFNSVISFVGFVYNPIMVAISSIQQFGDGNVITNTINFGVRSIGFGSGNFYFGGVINGFGLLFTFYLLKTKYISICKAVVILIVLTLTGMFIARTTVIGLGLGLCYYFYKLPFKNVITFATLIFVGAVIIVISGILDNINTSWVFDFIRNFISNGTISNQSLDHLNSMWNIEISPKTYIIGDGLSKYNDGRYYMDTDVGYLRNILYFGVVGTVLGYFLYAYVLCRQIIKVSLDRNIAHLIFWLFIYLLIINYKGLPDYNFMMFLLFSIMLRNKISICNKL